MQIESIMKPSTFNESVATTADDLASTCFNFSDSATETTDAALSEGDATMRHLLVRARAALLRLRDCSGDGDDVANLSDALAEVNDWLELAEQENEASASASAAEADQSTSSCRIRTWTPAAAVDADAANLLDNPDGDEDTESDASSLQSASSLIPTELLNQFDRLAGLQGAGGKPSGQLPTTARSARRCQLRRCLLARPPSAALTDRLLKGRGLLKKATSQIGAQQQQQQQQKQQQQKQQRRQPSKKPAQQRTLFSTLVSNELTNEVQTPSVPTATAEKPQQQQQQQRTRSAASRKKKSSQQAVHETRVMAIVKHNDTGAYDQQLWSL